MKKAQGTFEASRASTAEPTFPDGSLRAPETLTGPAKAEYERLAKLLIGQGLFPATGQGELATGCWWFGQWAEATRQIERYGQVVQTDYGLKANPALRIAATASGHYFTMCGRFGLDPASAGKVTARPKGEDADELARKRAERRAAR